jgi:DNA-directed RNA polymerase specialized sigma24 family protein
MSVAAIAVRPQLLLRARELCGRRADVDAEDLVGVALLALVAKPPNPKTPAQLHRWLRTVLRNQGARAYRNLHGATFVSYEGMQEARARGASD